MSLFKASLPAAATNMMSFALALLISSSSAWLKAPPPQELLRTRTLTPAILAWTAKSIAVMASAVLPEPPASRNLRPIKVTVQLTPTTPAPLFPTAPIVPETWLPWLLSSRGAPVASEDIEPVGPARSSPYPARVAPDIGGQVGMGVVDASVDHTDHYAARASRDVPGRNRVDVCARGASGSKDGLAGVPQSP